MNQARHGFGLSMEEAGTVLALSGAAALTGKVCSIILFWHLIFPVLLGWVRAAGGLAAGPALPADRPLLRRTQPRSPPVRPRPLHVRPGQRWGYTFNNVNNLLMC